VDDPNASPPVKIIYALVLSFIRVVCVGLLLKILICIARPLRTLSAGALSRPYFSLYALLYMIWGVVAATIVNIPPVLEFRQKTLLVLTLGIYERRLEVVEPVKDSYRESKTGRVGGDEKVGCEVCDADGAGRGRPCGDFRLWRWLPRHR